MSLELQEFKKQCRTQPENFGWFGDDKMFKTWGFTPFGTHRDADLLTTSNWQFVNEDLMKRFPDAFEICGTSHWAVGWFEHLAVDLGNDAAVEAVMEWMAELADYPVADEDHYSNLQDEEFSSNCEVRRMTKTTYEWQMYGCGFSDEKFKSEEEAWRAASDHFYDSEWSY